MITITLFPWGLWFERVIGISIILLLMVSAIAYVIIIMVSLFPSIRKLLNQWMNKIRCKEHIDLV